MIYPDGTQPASPRCINCNAVPRMLFDFIKEDKEPLPTPRARGTNPNREPAPE